MKKLIFSLILSISMVSTAPASLLKDLIGFYQISDSDSALYESYYDANALKNSFVNGYFDDLRLAVLADFAFKYVKENPTSLDVFIEYEGADDLEEDAQAICRQAENIGFAISLEDARVIRCLHLSLQAVMSFPVWDDSKNAFIEFPLWDYKNNVFIEDEELLMLRPIDDESVEETLMRVHGARFALNIQEFALKRLKAKAKGITILPIAIKSMKCHGLVK